jgi:hypothetical protein
MYDETFKTKVIVLIGNIIMCVTSHSSIISVRVSSLILAIPISKIKGKMSKLPISNFILQKLPSTLESFLACVFVTLSAVVVNSITTPFFMIAAIPLFILYYLIQNFFRASAR